jgi:ABC-type polysaccharide/polyol phosphate transport system ATPase subunit
MIIGLLGRNGSGKSTLKIIFGIETADFKFVELTVLLKKN